ncbi:MAG: antitoxin Xre-like helix-turn-helix domain-containing protein, partial [Candidatus Velthaea sp.]
MINVSEHLAGPALRTFSNVADSWRLTHRERRALLGAVSPTTYDRMRRAPDSARLGPDTLERISHVLAIYKA